MVGQFQKCEKKKKILKTNYSLPTCFKGGGGGRGVWWCHDFLAVLCQNCAQIIT